MWVFVSYYTITHEVPWQFISCESDWNFQCQYLFATTLNLQVTLYPFTYFLLFYLETIIVNYHLFTHIHLAYTGEKKVTPKFGVITKRQLGQNIKSEVKCPPINHQIPQYTPYWLQNVMFKFQIIFLTDAFTWKCQKLIVVLIKYPWCHSACLKKLTSLVLCNIWLCKWWFPKQIENEITKLIMEYCWLDNVLEILRG